MVSLLFEKEGGFSSIFVYLEICVVFKLCQFVFLPTFVSSSCVGSYLFFLSTLLVLMEDLSTRWKKLSLSESEENWVALRIDRRKRDFILAGKFFTRRSLNV